MGLTCSPSEGLVGTVQIVYGASGEIGLRCILPEPQGTWLNPYPIDVTVGYISVSGNTESVQTSEAQYYSPCAPTVDEGGPELVYTFVAPVAGTLTLTLSYDYSVDVDVHLLSAPSANNCIARSNAGLTYQLIEGAQYWVVVDTFCSGGSCYSGPYTLTITFN